MIGLISYAVAMASFAVAPSPALLVPGRLILGVAMVGSFWIAAAYLGDIVAPEERGIAFGLSTTAMGLGFAVGPIIGGTLADAVSLRWAYAIGAVIGLLTAGYVRRSLWQPARKRTTLSRGRASIRESLAVGRSRALIAISVASILFAFSFEGAVATIFPLHGRDVGITDAAIGTMFALRALVSSAVRLPGGTLAGRFGSRRVVLIAAVVEIAAMIGLGLSDTRGALMLFLAIEGLAFGAFLASSQSYLAEHTVAETRGAATGFYSMVGGLGNTLAPLSLGFIGDRAGLSAPFFFTTALMILGLTLISWLWYRPGDGGAVQPAAIRQTPSS
jgi:DHA1 family tetracycline resistance protein-like MFS transporter